MNYYHLCPLKQTKLHSSLLPRILSRLKKQGKKLYLKEETWELSNRKSWTKEWHLWRRSLLKVQVTLIPNVKDDDWGERSDGGLYTIVWSSMHSHATWSLANCSFLLRGLTRTVTTIFSSRTLGPLGVETGVLSIFEFGVLGVLLTVIFLLESIRFPR